MQSNFYIFSENYTPEVIDLLRRIDLFKAQYMSSEEGALIKLGENNIEQFYENSGLKVILRTIEYTFHKNELLKSALIEYTTFASALKNNILADFLVFREDSEGRVKKDNIDRTFYNMYLPLKESGLGLFYQPNFFFKGDRAIAYISNSDDLIKNDISEIVDEFDTIKSLHEIKLVNFIKIPSEKGNVFTQNASIPVANIDEITESIKKSKYTLFQHHLLLHYLMDKNFLANEQKNTLTYLISIPILASSTDFEHGRNGVYNGQGACFIYLEFERGFNNFEILEKIARNVLSLIKDITYNYLFHTGYLLYKESLLNSFKSAIAAIMSRNGSHNLGSHVIASTAVKFHEIYDNQTLLKYIQQRMDFIAQITTELPNWSYPSWFIRDVMRRFYLQRNLLNYIAESEGLNAYEFQSREPAGQKSKKLLVRIVDSAFKDIIPFNIDKIEKFELKGDVLIAIPGGVVGTHAIYTILENIIRNSVKHAWESTRNDNFELIIRILNDEKKNYVKFQVLDNCSFEKSQERNIDLADSINQKITKSFVDTFGRLLKENWGIAEIKIAAGYLNQKDIETIGSKGEHLLFNDDTGDGLVKAVNVKKNNKIYFGYEFSIPRPKEIFIISNNVHDDIKKQALQSNVHIESNIPESIDYELVVINKDVYARIEREEVSIEKFPYRILLSGDKTNKANSLYSKRIATIGDLQLDRKTDWEKLKLSLYKRWVEHLMSLYGTDNQKYYLFISTSEDVVQNNGGEFDNLHLIIRKCHESIKNQANISDSEEIRKFDEWFLNKSNYQNIESFLDLEDFVSCSNLSQETKNVLKRNIKFLVNSFNKLHRKYEEDIETLPRIFRARNSTNNVSRNNQVPKILSKLEKDIIPLQIKITTDFDEVYRKKNAIVLKRHCEIKNYWFYGEALSGAQYYFSLLENDLDIYFQNKLLLQIIENAFLKILIVDERAAEFYYALDIATKKRFDKAGIDIAGIVKYEDERGNECEETIVNIDAKLNEANFFIKDISLPYHLLIIHQGVLDKIYRTVENISRALEKIKRKIPFIVITSGRGTPAELPMNEKFIPFSDIKEYLFKKYHEKILLTNILMKVISRGRTDE